MAKPHLKTDVLAFLRTQAARDESACSAQNIAASVQGSRATVNRYLAQLVQEGALLRTGVGPATRYALPAAQTFPPESIVLPASGARVAEPAPPAYAAAADGQIFQFSPRHQSLLRALQAPIGSRNPVGYQRALLEGYQPNVSALLPPALAADLFAKGRTQGQLPAGTYARKVLEQLLIDLSWHSSRLEGNRMSLLDTQTLFAQGRTTADDLDAVMLLNHKEAIEFIVDAVPEYGIREDVVRNIQALLMQGLLLNPESVGAIRSTVVNIAHSVYVPLQAPHLLEDMLRLVIDKARLIKNPVEAAFFLWVHTAYLQPFEDGNKRTSRLCANLPLLLQNCAPLSFLDVQSADYALAVLAIYERQDVSLAVDLFEWTCLRSIRKYGVVLQSMGAPDPLRARYREQLGEAIRAVVHHRQPVGTALASLNIPAQDQAEFEQLLNQELHSLQAYNCARYRLSIRITQEWIAQGRSVLQ